MRPGYDATTYPLSWPAMQPRTKQPRRASFGTKKADNPGGYAYLHKKTVYEALSTLDDELRRLGARHVIISTNMQTRLDGRPRSGQGEPRDSGAAVYFMLKSEPRVLACDKWDRVADNLYAVAKTIEALRRIERWGAGEQHQAFRGYAVLPESASGSRWWDVRCESCGRDVIADGAGRLYEIDGAGSATTHTCWQS